MSDLRKNPDTTDTTEAVLGRINRALPFSDEAERAVLSCIMNDPVKFLDEARELLPEGAFYHAQSARLYALLLAMGDARAAIDLVTVTNFARDRGELEALGGPGGIGEYYTFHTLAAHFRHYIDIVRDKLVLRRMIDACARGIESAHLMDAGTTGEGGATVTDILDALQRDVLAITLAREARGPVHIKEAAHDVMDASEKAMDSLRRGESVTGMELGFSADVDRMLNGAEAGDRIVIGAHSTTGKTALLMNIATHFTRKYQAPGLIFSLDGMNITLARRAMAEISDVNINEIQTGVGLFEKDHSKLQSLQNAQRIVAGLPIWLDDRAGLSIQQAVATMRRFKKAHGIKWVAGDFFQKFTCPSRRNQFNEVQELTAVSNLWMNAVLDLDLIGIMLAQLNRDVKGDRPTQHNIKQCAALFEDATKVLLLSNEHRDLEELKAAEEHIPLKDRQHAPALQLGEKIVCCQVEKNKDGSTGPVWVRLWGPKMRFRALVPGKKVYASAFNKEGRAADGRA